MARIMSLTEAQKARFPEFVRKWTDIGLSTQPANREKAEQAIVGLYRLAKLKEPRVIWLPCPVSAALSATVYNIARNLRFAEGHPPVFTAVDSAVGSAVDSATRSSMRDAARNAGWSFFWGQFGAGYCAWADYFAEVLAISIDRNYLDLCESCGFYWLLDDVCFASERPAAINLDAGGRLHCETGQSIGYPSGWGLYHWHGVAVPSRVIEDPASITVDQIDAEANAEVRRVMMERYGWARFLKDGGAKLLDHDDHWGTLYRREIPGDEPLVMVEVINRSPEPDGSFRHYLLRVSPECRPLLDDGVGEPQALTALNAVASTFGVRGADYARALAAES